MDELNLTIDFSEKEDKLGIINSFEYALGIPLSQRGSWDAFSDNLRSLDTESEVIRARNPKSLHLVLKDIGDFEQRCRNINSNDYNNFLSVLSNATDKSQRYDKIDFTYEIANRIDGN